MKGYGHINVSNVNSNVSECITLTYSIKDVGNPTKARALRKELDDLIKSEDNSTVTLMIGQVDTEDEQCDMKYQVRSCNNEKAAREYKGIIDKYLSKKGGQTTLDDGNSSV